MNKKLKINIATEDESGTESDLFTSARLGRAGARTPRATTSSTKSSPAKTKTRSVAKGTARNGNGGGALTGLSKSDRYVYRYLVSLPRMSGSAKRDTVIASIPDIQAACDISPRQ